MLPEAPTVREIVDRSRWLRSFAQARIAAAVAVLGECTFAILDSALDRPIFLIRMRIAHGVFAAGVLVFLQVKRRTLSLGAVVASTLLVLLPLLPIFWVAESEAVATGRPWGPFVGHRLILLAAAMLVPGPLWVAAVVAAVFAASALLHYLVLSGTIVGLGEPWITGFHAVVAVAILSLRGQLDVLKEKLARARAAAHSLAELARTARFVKDGTASPLQTIVAATLLLRHGATDTSELLDRIDRAAERIERLVTTLDSYESSRLVESESFDPRSELERQRAELVHRARSLSSGGSPSSTSSA
jgi:hypothetical protein